MVISGLSTGRTVDQWCRSECLDHRSEGVESREDRRALGTSPTWGSGWSHGPEP